MTRRTSRKPSRRTSKPKKLKMQWGPAIDYDTRIALGLPVHGKKQRRSSLRRNSRKRNTAYVATRGPRSLPFKSPSERGTNPEGLTWDEWRQAAGTGGLTTAKLLAAWQAGEDPTEHRALRKNSRRRTSLRRNSRAFRTSFHRDGTVTYWNVYQQGWVRARRERDIPMETLSVTERERIRRHLTHTPLRKNSRRHTSLRRNDFAPEKIVDGLRVVVRRSRSSFDRGYYATIYGRDGTSLPGPTRRTIAETFEATRQALARAR